MPAFAISVQVFRPGMVPGAGIVQLPSRRPSPAEMRAAVAPYLESEWGDGLEVWHRGMLLTMAINAIAWQCGCAVNAPATAIFRAGILRRNPRLMPEQLAPIYGPAVLFPFSIAS